MTWPAERPLVAIFGAGRNGSTLLVRLLDGSSGLWLHPVETNYLCVFDDLVRLGRSSAETVQNATTRALAALGGELAAERLVTEYAHHWEEIEDTYVRRLEQPLERRADPADALRTRQTYDVRSFLPAFLETTRLAYDWRPEEPAALVFKTIETPYVDDYLQVFPDLRCLHILRDPVPNYASLKRTRAHFKRYPFYQGGDELRTFLEARWLPHARAIARLAEAKQGRHLVVRYEDLRTEPIRLIGQICAWLGVSPPDDPEQLTVLGGRRMTTMPANPSQPGVDPPSRVVADMEQRFDYAQVVTARERELIARCTGGLAERIGYASSHGGGRLAAFRLWLRWLPPDRSERLNPGSWLRWGWALARRRAYVTRKLLAGGGAAS